MGVGNDCRSRIIYFGHIVVKFDFLFIRSCRGFLAVQKLASWSIGAVELLVEALALLRLIVSWLVRPLLQLV